MLNDYTYWLLMWTHLHIWRQHLLHAHSCVCPTDCCGSPQVGSQYQYKLHCPDEWAQFPGQRRHVGRALTLNGECNECNLIVHTIWIKSMLLLIFFFTFKWLNDYLCFNKLLYKTSLHVTKRLKAYLLIQIQVVCKLHWHLEHSRNHHTLCPMYCCSKLLLDPHWNLYLHEVWCYHLYRLLDLKYSSKMNQLLHTSAAHIQHTHTHTILKKINWNSIWRLFNCPN